ncbi:MAG: uroporphyrinogen decarboxylase family protein [Phycisphaeraceae bacterium]
MINEDHAKLAINRRPSVDRSEYLDHMTFQANRRPLFTEIFGPLIGLREEWIEQGATPEELDLSAFRFRCPEFGSVPVNVRWLGGPEPRVIEDTADALVYIDHMGRRMRCARKVATLALPETYPLRDKDDWQKIKHHYTFSEERFGADWERIAREHLAAGRVLRVGIPGGYDELRQLMGEEALAMNCYDAPELLEEILTTIGDMAVQVLDRVSSRVTIDQLSVHEDMAGRSGPLFGPRQVEQFVIPYYRRIWDMLRQRGTRLFDQDSDGDLRPVLPAFLEAGINVIHPVEPAAGMDLVELRETFGTQLAFYGGIDKHVLRRDRAAIEAELEYKIPPMVHTGGCMLGLDHRIPNGTPLANYRFYIEKAWQIMEREAAQLGAEPLPQEP